VIRKAVPSDAKPICDIYNHYVSTSHCTFETIEISIDEMTKRMDNVSANYSWLVMEKEKQIVGYAYATQWKQRQAYQKTVESTIYFDPNNIGKGYAYGLYAALIDELKQLKIHAVLGGIALPNQPSIYLHEKLGFVKVGQLNEVGFKCNRWVDVGYWELILR